MTDVRERDKTINEVSVIVTVEKFDEENVVVCIPDEILQKLNCSIGDSFHVSVVQPNVIVLTKQPQIPQSALDAAVDFFGGDEQSAFLFLLKLSVAMDKETKCSDDDFTKRALELIARLERGITD